MHIMQTQNLTTPYHIFSNNILISHEKSIGELSLTLTLVLSWLGGNCFEKYEHFKKE